MKKYRGKIKEKDLEQLAVVKKFGINFLVSFDKDFKKFKEYKTPKIFYVVFLVRRDFCLDFYLLMGDPTSFYVRTF